MERKDREARKGFFFAIFAILAFPVVTGVAAQQQALTGPREAIPQVLKDGVKTLHDVAIAQ